MIRRICPAHLSADEYGQFLAEKFDAHRAEALAEAKTEVIAWLLKKGHEQATWDTEVLASKVDRGAVRIFLGTGHYRDAMDEHRTEVLAADGQAYDGELAMARGLIRVLRTVARQDDLREVQRLLIEHASDETAAYAERGMVAAPTATPFFQIGHTYRSRYRTFRCDAISPHPITGETRAIGWLTDDGTLPGLWAMDPDDYRLGGWNDITEAGDVG